MCALTQRNNTYSNLFSSGLGHFIPSLWIHKLRRFFSSLFELTYIWQIRILSPSEIAHQSLSRMTSKMSLGVTKFQYVGPQFPWLWNSRTMTSSQNCYEAGNRKQWTWQSFVSLNILNGGQPLLRLLINSKFTQMWEGNPRTHILSSFLVVWTSPSQSTSHSLVFLSAELVM